MRHAGYICLYPRTMLGAGKASDCGTWRDSALRAFTVAGQFRNKLPPLPYPLTRGGSGWGRTGLPTFVLLMWAADELTF